MSKMEQTDNRAVGTGLEIAVIGMAGRFPGADNCTQFWENLKNGLETISFFSEEELKASRIQPELVKDPNYVKARGVLKDKEYFDASFFGYTPIVAEVLDPQVRIFHECCWHALENSGYEPDTCKGLIGIYAGASSSLKWEALSFLSGKASVLGVFALSLLGRDFLCTQTSYHLNLKGPAVFVQTACSTSLVAIHLACQGLLGGECDIALAGGVTMEPHRKMGYMFQDGLILSPDGHCRAFAATSAGTVGGEGIGIVVLKRLREAAADGDFIYAVIKGSAVNNDGYRKVGFTAPSINGQAEVVLAAQLMANVKPESIGYIETHGTGTPLGDPVEVNALKKVFKTNGKNSCALGSVKTNVGHLDSAAGAAGFIKTVLALKHKLIPPSLHFEAPNPEIDFEDSPFFVNRELTEWKSDKFPLRAGVSSFGIGGTNAHVVLEEWPHSHADSASSKEYQIILLSARTRSALDKTAENLANHLKNNPGINLADAAYTLQVGRKAFEYRKILDCFTVKEAVEKLSSPAAGKEDAFVGEEGTKPVVFMFSGQGTQYINMGRDLYQEEPLFRQEMDRCFDILAPIQGFSIKDILYPGDNIPAAPKTRHQVSKPSILPTASSRFFHQDVVQPMMFVFEYALARLLIEWGIQPYAMIGYSIGEYVAACLAGVFCLEDALSLVALRGKLMHETPGGVMLSVPMPEQELAPLLNDDLSIAVVNGPSCIVSGPEKAVRRFENQLKDKKYLCMRLSISHAGHSKMMEPILAQFEEAVKKVQLNSPEIPFISSVTATWLEANEAIDPRYWADHLRKTVRFAEGLKKLVDTTHSIFIEIGPGRDLSNMLGRFLDGKSAQKVVNLIKPPQKNVPDSHYLLSRLGRLWLYGINIDWQEFYSGKERHRLPLPLYPFEQQRYWFDDRLIQAGEELFFSMTSSPGFQVDRLHQGNGLTPLSKIERGTLHLRERPELSIPYTPPSDETEQILVNIWQKFLGINRIGIDDNFFDLGGDSLKGASLLSVIQKELNVHIPSRVFFANPIIRKVASFVQDGSPRTSHVFIKATERKEYYTLSLTQKRLYIVQQVVLEDTSYNIPTMYILEGKLDRKRFAETFETLIKRHENLRTSFEVIDQEPVQKIHNQASFEIEYSGKGASAKGPGNEEYMIEKMIQNFVRPFNLSQAPLLRVGLTEIEEDKYVLMSDIHHIIADGISLRMIMRDFILLYAGKELPLLSIQYKDFSEWQISERGSETIKEQEEYWLREFAGEKPGLNLPFDYPRPAVQSFAGETTAFEIDENETRRLRELAAQEGATLFIVLAAVYNVLLFKISSQEDIIMGVGINRRVSEELNHVVGMFVNTVALRNYPEKEKTFKGFLRDVREKTLLAFDNQDYPFDELVDKVLPGRDRKQNPLLNVFIVAEPTEGALSLNIPEVELLEFKINSYEYKNKTSKFDISLLYSELADRLLIKFEYSTKLFKRETVERFIVYFKDIVASVVQDKNIKLKDIKISHDLLSAAPDIIHTEQSDFRL